MINKLKTHTLDFDFTRFYLNIRNDDLCHTRLRNKTMDLQS